MLHAHPCVGKRRGSTHAQIRPAGLLAFVFSHTGHSDAPFGGLCVLFRLAGAGFGARGPVAKRGACAAAHVGQRPDGAGGGGGGGTGLSAGAAERHRRRRDPVPGARRERAAGAGRHRAFGGQLRQRRACPGGPAAGRHAEHLHRPVSGHHAGQPGPGVGGPGGPPGEPDRPAGTERAGEPGPFGEPGALPRTGGGHRLHRHAGPAGGPRSPAAGRGVAGGAAPAAGRTAHRPARRAAGGERQPAHRPFRRRPLRPGGHPHLAGQRERRGHRRDGARPL